MFDDTILDFNFILITAAKELSDCTFSISLFGCCLSTFVRCTKIWSVISARDDDTFWLSGDIIHPLEVKVKVVERRPW
jgi:hypothetical protein